MRGQDPKSLSAAKQTPAGNKANIVWRAIAFNQTDVIKKIDQDLAYARPIKHRSPQHERPI